MTYTQPREFYQARVAGLVQEIERECSPSGEVLSSRARQFARDISRNSSLDMTDSEIRDFDQLTRAKAAVVLENYTIASSYQRMDDFWRDAARQERGESRSAYWDTYESGRRRRAETQLAQAYGAEAALLLNSGMSAIYCALLSLTDAGTDVVTHHRAYFETAELLSEVVCDSRSIRSVDVSSSSALERALEIPSSRERTSTSRLVLAETATNTPDPLTIPLDHTHASDLFLLLDNSVLSHGLRFPDIVGELQSKDVVVVESGSKYLTGLASVGVVYGGANSIEAVRRFSRRTGQQLQGTGLAYLNDVDIDLASERVQLHSAAVQAFADELDTRLWHCQVIGGDCRGCTGLPKLAGSHGPGALVFLTSVNEDLRLESMLDRWIEWSMKSPQPIRVQAGFGWPWTTARCYAGAFLNQADSPSYLRVSVGIMSAQAARRQAAGLNHVAQAERSER
jgi:cystathionine beta-lyase/cystathionine gamma-synthase